MWISHETTRRGCRTPVPLTAPAPVPAPVSAAAPAAVRSPAPVPEESLIRIREFLQHDEVSAIPEDVLKCSFADELGEEFLDDAAEGLRSPAPRRFQPELLAFLEDWVSSREGSP